MKYSTIALVVAAPAICSAQEHPFIRVSVRIDTDKVLRQMDPRKIGSTNAAFWTGKDHFESPVINGWMKDMAPALIRIPGGSYADHIYWNGHGVRGPDGKVDPTRMKDGYPDVNYAAGIYEPSFTAARQTHIPGQSAAQNVDVKTMHEFVKAIPGASPLIIANAGTGRAVDAAEWVRWANHKMGYGVQYVEVGNELDGDWEPGHIMPDGKHMTGEIYAARFRDFARAVKTIDPKVKVGGAAGGTGEGSFNYDMLRLAGDDVDFVSIHNYYGTRLNTVDEAFDKLEQITSNEVNLAKRWIQRFQPNRADKIEIIYTEWNLTDQPGDFCSDQYSALWGSWFLALAARNGVDAANHWDLFTHGDGTGFAMIHADGRSFVRKSQYYMFQLWNNYMGPQLVTADLSGSKRVKVIASKSADDLYVMLLNTDRDSDAEVKLDLAGFDAAPTGEQAILTTREYFWPPNGKKPLWSEGIRVEPVAVGNDLTMKLAPFSVNYVRLARQGSPSAERLASAQRPARKPVGVPELSFILPAEMYVGDTVDGVIVATDSGTGKGYPEPLPPARLTADGDAGFDRPAARLSEAAGRFSLKPAQAGELRLTATSGTATANKTIKVKPSIPRPFVFWDFRDPIATNEKVFKSDWKLVNDEGMRPNKGVARIDLPAEGVIPAGGKAPRALLIVTQLPSREKVIRENIRGAFFDLMLSPDFQCDDPNVSLQIVMQTPLKGYWMPIGNVKLLENKDGKWHRHQVDITDETNIKAVGGVYNLWFVLGASQPVKGSLYLDQIGLMVR